MRKYTIHQGVWARSKYLSYVRKIVIINILNMQTINTTRFLATEYLRLSQRLIEIFRNRTFFGKYA